MKKGFTLLELLAVIVVLAIIALIVTPFVTDAIKEARKGAKKNDVYGIISAAETRYATQLAKGVDYAGEVITYTDGVSSNTNFKFKGRIPDSGIVRITSTGVVTVENLEIDGSYYHGSSKDDLKETEEALYKEAILNGSDPELYQGMIPVNIASNGTVTVANISASWYDYETHNWANVVLVDTTNATIKAKYFNNDMTLKKQTTTVTIPESEILQYYVWIPRYKYKLWNTENGSSNPQAIEITFENKYSKKINDNSNGQYLTHPAFTFGGSELRGIWVGKFETSGTSTDLTIKPNVQSLTNINVGTMFNSVRGLEVNNNKYGLLANEVDSHMMKNMEWGAVAYLSHSIYGRYINPTTCISSGCEVWINNANTGYGNGAVVANTPQWGPSITGCSGASVSAGVVNNLESCQTPAQAYNGSTGVNASTTGNITGIYDMSGGSWEYVMGNMSQSNGTYYKSSSGLDDPGAKYYNSYQYSETVYIDHERGLLGDATKETLRTFGSISGGWYNDYAYLPNGSYAWFVRGGYASYTSSAGLFHFSRSPGGSYSAYGFRAVLSR